MRGKAASWTQVIYATNPDAPTHWINTDLILSKQASIYYSRPEDNPYNPKDYIDRLKNLTGVYYQRLYLGLWVQAEGAIYDEYDSSIHLVDEVNVDMDGRFVVGIDFGYTNPFSASLYYLDNDDNIYLWKQVYRTKRTVEEHVPAIREMVEGVKVEAWITDHDAEDRATLEMHMGIRTQGAYKAVLPGISAVKQRLKDKRLFFKRNAVAEIDIQMQDMKRPLYTVDEIPGYRWSDKKQDTPIKENDHGLDELRYVIAYVDKIGARTARITTRAQMDNYAMRPEKERDKIGF
jgi:phage terminase large subunit